MTPAERSAITNGIWLCGSCGTRVDNDAVAYPVELLKAWKATAEQSARRRQGQKLFTQADAQKQMESVFSASPNGFSRNALANAVSAYASHLKSLDPRFDVLVTQQGGQTRVELSSQSAVPISLKFLPSQDEAARIALSDLLAHGGNKSIDVRSVAAHGSPLISKLLGKGGPGELQLATVDHPAALRLWLNMPDGKKVDLLTMEGTITGGTRTATITTSAFDGVFAVSARLPYDDGEKEHFLQLTYGLALAAWHGRNVKRLPGITPLLMLFRGVLDGGRLMAEVFAGEHSVCIADITPADQAFAGQQHTLLAYAKYAQTLANRLNFALTFVADHSFNADEFFDVEETASIADGTAIGGVQSDIAFEIVWDRPTELMPLQGTRVSINFNEQEG